MVNVGDYVNKSGYKFKVLGIRGSTLDLKGMDGQGETLGEMRFVSPWIEPTKKKHKK